MTDTAAPLDRRASDMLCGEHTATLQGIIAAEEDRKKENDARQREIGQLFELLRVSTANVTSLSTSVATMKVVYEDDHQRTEILWNKSQQTMGKTESQALLRSWLQIIISGTIGALASWVYTVLHHVK